MAQTHVGKLTKNVTVTIQVSDNPPEPGRSHILNVEWSRTPNRVVFRRYVKWLNIVNQQLADTWGIGLSYVYQLTEHPSGWRAFVYEPGGTPTKIDLGAVL